jgi:hypothetical protein
MAAIARVHGETEMRILVIALLCPMALSSWAEEKKNPVKTPPTYFKVEIRGTLRVTKTASGRFEPLRLAKQPVKATIDLSNVSMRLDFGDDKNLAALAKKLDGKTVLVSGELLRAVEKDLSGYPSLDLEPRLAVQSPLSKYPRLWFVDYIQVTALKAVE